MLDRVALLALLLAPIVVAVAVCWVTALYEAWLLYLLVPLFIIYTIEHWDTYLGLSPIRNHFQTKEN